MALFNPTKSYVRAPSHAPAASALHHNPSSQVVFALRTQPPINFNLALTQHAKLHGLNVSHVGYHPHPTGTKMSVVVSGALENAKKFADSAVYKFGAYIRQAEVGAAGQGIFKR